MRAVMQDHLPGQRAVGQCTIFGVTGAAIIQGLGIGVLVSLLFSMVPLLEVRNVKPSLLLRQEAPAGRRWIRKKPWL